MLPPALRSLFSDATFNGARQRKVRVTDIPLIESEKLGLVEKQKTTLITYKDADTADWKDNPEAYRIETIQVHQGSTLSVNLAPGGGCAVRVKLK